MLYPLLIGLATVIILVLAVIAIYFQVKVKRQRIKQQAQQEAQEKAGRDQRERLNKSIQIIAKGAQEDQLTLTEASIRIKVLLDGLGVDETVRKEYIAFYELARATDHIPILDEWKSLSLKKRVVFDKERDELETKYREFVLDAARRIQGRTF